jgi:hypothetical protein
VAAAALPVTAVALILTLGERHGLSADQFAWAGVRYWRAARRLVLAPEGLPALAGGRRGLGALRLPPRAVDADGVMDLDGEGVAVICRASSVNFGLRSESEQAALVAAFAAFLNGLTATGGSVQFVVRTERANLDVEVDSLLEGAGGLAHPDLEAAARDHAAFLASLAARHDALRREILVVFREAPTGRAALRRRAEEAAGLLARAGIHLTRLDGPETMATLRGAADPDAPSVPGDGVDFDAVIRKGGR